MGPHDTTTADIMRLASALTEPELDRLAHALGWPKLFAIRCRRFGNPKWKYPSRRYYCEWHRGADDPDWAAVRAAGLATPRQAGGGTTWTVTPLGQAVVRVRLQAEIELVTYAGTDNDLDEADAQGGE